MRAQRFLRGPRYLDLVLKRCLSTSPRILNSLEGTIEASEAPNPVPKAQGTTSKLFTDKAFGVRLPEDQLVNIHLRSSLHPLLQKGCYTEGAKLKRGNVESDLDENGVPTWGDWGIPINFVSRAGQATNDFPNLWLRDNCRCSSCVNQDTMQRAFDTFSIPRDIIPKEVVTEAGGLHVTWFYENHASFYPWEWLYKHSQSGSGKHEANKNLPITYWGTEIAESPPSVHYDEIMASDGGVGLWTEKIRRYGFSYVDGCPVDPEKTQTLLERIAFIRTTHYGGFYDFTSDLTMKDTAYTSLPLGPHTDTTYFSDPAGLQMFHLLSHTDGEGGKSLLVDGFKAVQQLKKSAPRAYDALLHTPMAWHASGNEGVTITPGKKFPVLMLAERFRHDTRVLQVRWNNDDRGVVGLGHRAERWYEAARLWNDILSSEEMQYWAQLEPGRPLIFDNWRVLHGRSAFTGKRRICGGYVNHDDFISRWRNTNFSRVEVLKQIL